MNMRRRLILLFSLLALLLAWYAVSLRGGFWLLLWPSLSFSLVAAAYAGLGPSLFAKTQAGTLPPRTVLMLGPYLLLSWVGWLALRALQGKAPWAQVAPEIFLGRRLEEHELPAGSALIVDLTCEFSTRHPARPARRYLCLPTLDATAPEAAAFRGLIEELRAVNDKIYIHCAAGYGRSATVAAALLIARGLAETPEEAEERLQESRPGVKLNAEQRGLLRDFAGTWERPLG